MLDLKFLTKDFVWEIKSDVLILLISSWHSFFAESSLLNCKNSSKGHLLFSNLSITSKNWHFLIYSSILLFIDCNFDSIEDFKFFNLFKKLLP